jgi:Gamma-aminobutyrate permease and related permeases
MSNKKSGLSAFELTMMAVGTVIGGSFFLGSAIPIRSAGPSVIISFVFGGILVYLILFALSEMTVADADPGSFRAFAQSAFGPAAGFITGWVYWTGMILAMSSESVAVSVFFRLWFPQAPILLIGTLVILMITLINLMGAGWISKLETSLAAVKAIAIISFIFIAIVLITGIMPSKMPVGIGALANEPLFSGGAAGVAGSMLIVMFAYAGFEVIGLAASETVKPHKTVPRAIAGTVLALTGLYIGAVALLLPLLPTSNINAEISPFVAALEYRGIYWAAGIINIVLVTAILSTMLAATFALGRMMRSLVDDGYAPQWLKDKGDIPYKGIVFSGAAMLAALALSFVLPKQVYLFLVGSGGFSLLFTYLVILLSHYRFRKKHGCPPKGSCQFPGYPFTSWFAIASLAAIIVSMPLIPGQGAGLIAGVILVIFYMVCYLVMQRARRTRRYEKRI